MSKKLVALAALFVALSRPGSAQTALTQTRPGEALLGPYSTDQAVQGVPVSTHAYVFLAVKSAADPIELGVRIVADLSDLQRKIGPIVDTITLPTDNCARFALDNLVARIWGKQITISGDVASLKLNGDVDVWTCAKNPIPCSKFEGWSLKFYDCNPPIKNRNVNQPFEATLPFRLTSAGPQAIEVKLGDPSVNLGGLLGNVTGGILSIAGVDISSSAKKALEEVMNPLLLKRSLPEALLPFNPVITRAELLDDLGVLTATLEMNVSVDSKTLEGFGQLFQPGSPAAE